METLKQATDEDLIAILIKAAIDQKQFHGELYPKIKCFQNILKVDYESPEIHELAKKSLEIYVKKDGLTLFKRLMNEEGFEEE